MQPQLLVQLKCFDFLRNLKRILIEIGSLFAGRLNIPQSRRQRLDLWSSADNNKKQAGMNKSHCVWCNMEQTLHTITFSNNKTSLTRAALHYIMSISNWLWSADPTINFEIFNFVLAVTDSCGKDCSNVLTTTLCILHCRECKNHHPFIIMGRKTSFYLSEIWVVVRLYII